MADSAVAITAGSGTNIDTYQITGGDHQQVVRHARATAETDNMWLASTTAATSQVAADASRLGVMVVNNSTGRVWFRFDSTAPTSALNGHHWYLEPGERWEVPEAWSTLAISMLAQIASGYVVTHLVTAA